MTKILSPIAGKVQEINLNVGDTITEDDEVFIVEAMKMETPVYGEAGVVKSILVNIGDKVEEEQPLAEVE